MTLKLHVRRLIGAIPGHVQVALAQEPADALARHFRAQVVPVEQLRDSRGDGGWCDGVSFTADRVICYAPSPASRRQNFTLLHELGHLLVNDDDDALDWLADRSNPSGDLERLCDAIAAGILLPDSTVTRVLAANAPIAEHLQQLYDASRASEEVCAIALAAHLTSRGAVVLIQRRTATVAFAACSGWPPLPIPRGLEVPVRHPLRDLGTRQQWKGWTTSDFRLALSEHPGPSPTLDPFSDLLHVQAEAGPRRTTAILCDRTRLGNAIDDHPSEIRRLDLSAPGSSVVPICPRCGHEASSTSYPCDQCGVPPCPACGRCRCL